MFSVFLKVTVIVAAYHAAFILGFQNEIVDS